MGRRCWLDHELARRLYEPAPRGWCLALQGLDRIGDPIDSTTPETEAYPFQRPLFYAYRQPPDPAVKAFLGLALSEEGKTRFATAIQGP